MLFFFNVRSVIKFLFAYVFVNFHTLLCLFCPSCVIQNDRLALLAPGSTH